MYSSVDAGLSSCCCKFSWQTLLISQRPPCVSVCDCLGDARFSARRRQRPGRSQSNAVSFSSSSGALIMIGEPAFSRVPRFTVFRHQRLAPFNSHFPPFAYFRCRRWMSKQVGLASDAPYAVYVFLCDPIKVSNQVQKGVSCIIKKINIFFIYLFFFFVN